MQPIEEAEAIVRELDRRSSGRSPWCPHVPHPKQAEFLALTEEEALYGGAAGGGKSDALLMGALQFVHIPGYNALLLRRTFSEGLMAEAIMDRAEEWFSGTSAHWNGLKKQWVFPSGATIGFGYLSKKTDRYRYKGAAFQYIAFDELTEFPEADYRYLFSRLRKTSDLDVPLRMRSASNPGGIGHDWVKARFVEGGCRFVPAVLLDNPSADADSYLRQLAKLDPITRRQLEFGEWIQDASGLVYYAFESALCSTPGVPLLDHYALGIDFGFHDACAFVVVGWRKGDPTLYVVQSQKQSGLLPADVAELVKVMPFKFARMVGDTGGLGKGYAETMRQLYAIPVESAEKTNKQGFIDLLNGAFSRGEVKVYPKANGALIKELQSLSWNERRTKELDGQDNHLCDALLYIWRGVVNSVPKVRFVDTRKPERKVAEEDAKARYERNKAHHDVPERQRHVDPIFAGSGLGGGRDTLDDWIG